MDNKLLIDKYLEEKFDVIKEVNETIWDYAEIGVEEMKSVSLYKKLLEQEGFDVQTNIAGMPTAVMSNSATGKPMTVITPEYVVLLQLDHKAAKAEYSQIEEGGHGDGCGHNSLGAVAFGAPLAVNEYLQEQH